jgi:hypothetical protein
VSDLEALRTMLGAIAINLKAAVPSYNSTRRPRTVPFTPATRWSSNAPQGSTLQPGWNAA